MTLGELLLEKREKIVQRWIDYALAAYSPDSSALFARERDPFANPVGHSLRVGAVGLVDAILGGADPADAHRHLQEIVKIRAVQQMPASKAMAFVFQLKDAVRSELGKAATSSEYTSELAAFDRRVDEVALAAFDFYTRCRERVSELRLNEVKRSVSWVVDKINQRGSGVEPEIDGAGTKVGQGVNVPREGVR